MINYFDHWRYYVDNPTVQASTLIKYAAYAMDYEEEPDAPWLYFIRQFIFKQYLIRILHRTAAPSYLE